MNCIRETFEKVDELLDAHLQYSEANYQQAFCYLLSKHGTVEKECVVQYSFTDGDCPVIYGSGRIDVVFRKHGSDTVYIIELKISPKHYRIQNYMPQVQRYMLHYPYKKTQGVIICWSPHGSKMSPVQKAP